MIGNLYCKEMKDHRLSITIWTLSIGGLVVMGMAFYPVLTQDNLIEEMSVLFENPMMNGMMHIFGVDVTKMMSLTGFYEAYISIYVTLMACICAVMIASRILSKEENNKTAEFLFTRPISRSSIFFGKYLACLTLILIVNIGLSGSGLIGIELFKTGNSKVINTSKEILDEIIRGFKGNPRLFKDQFAFTEDDYFQYIIKKDMDELRSNEEVIKERNLDMEALNDLFNKLAETSPEQLFEEVEASPGYYMNLFGIPRDQQEEFMKGLTESRAQLKDFRRQLEQQPELYIEVFSASPEKYLLPFKNDQPALDRFISDFNLDKRIISRLFIYYKISNYFILSFYIFLLMVSLGAIGLFISLLIKRGKSITGIVVGLTFGLYFLNTISGITPQTGFIGYVSPFKFVNTDIMDPGYMLDWWRVLYFFILSTGFTTGSYLIFRKKDILV